jgi:hypothetical protein
MWYCCNSVYVIVKSDMVSEYFKTFNFNDRSQDE